MKNIQKKHIALIAIVLAFTSGCAPVGAPTPAPDEGIRTQVVNLFEEFVDLETSKLVKAKPKFGYDLLTIKSAFDYFPSVSIYGNSNGSQNPYSNLTWFPTVKKLKEMSRECDMSDDWTVVCKIEFQSSIPAVQGSESKATCLLEAPFANKKGPLKTPVSAEDLYDALSGLPKYKIGDCQPDWLIDVYGDPLYDQPSDSGFKPLFIERPEKVRANIAQVSKALMTLGGCEYPDFEIKKVIASGFGSYHVVTKHVDEDPAAQGEFYSAFNLVKEPEYDNYYVEQDGYGWENYFKCPMLGDHGQRINGSGSDINSNLG
jgi:hypothetical protein